jgi:hypothetical protein
VKGSIATYLYCVVASKTRPSLRRPPAGLPGTAPPRLLDAGGGLWAVVADAPLDRYGSEPIERGLSDLDWVSTCAVGHEAVVEHVARHGTTIPLKLFTLFATDARALAHIAEIRGRLDRLVRRLAGRDEWGVRVLLDERKARQRVSERALRETAGVSTGKRFLLLKKTQQQAVRDLAERGRAEIDRVFETLARHADDARRRTPVEAETLGRLLLDAAFLVRGSRVSRFRAAAKNAATRLERLGYDVTLSGPWPPYNFVAADGREARR